MLMMTESLGDENNDDSLPLCMFVEKRMQEATKQQEKDKKSAVPDEDCILICSSSSSSSEVESVDEDDLPLDKFVKKKSHNDSEPAHRDHLRTLSSEYEYYDFESSKSPEIASPVKQEAHVTKTNDKINVKIKHKERQVKKEVEESPPKKPRGRPRKKEPSPKKKSTQKQSVEKRRQLLFNDFKSRLNTATDVEITDEGLRLLVTDIEREFETQLKDDKLVVQKLATFRSKIKLSTNETFFRRILRGLVKPSELPKMNSHDMSDDRIRDQVRELQQNDLEMRKLYNEQLQHEKLKQLSHQKARFEMNVSSVSGLSSLVEELHDEQLTLVARPITSLLVESSTPHPETVNVAFDLHQATINLSSIEKTDTSLVETTAMTNTLPLIDTPISPAPFLPCDVTFSPTTKPATYCEPKITNPIVKKQVDTEVASDPNLIWKGYIEERSHLTYVRASHIVNVVNNQASTSMSHFDRLKRFKAAMHKMNKLTYKKKHISQKFSFWNDYLTPRDTYAAIYFNNDHEELLHKSYLIINGQKNNSLTNHEAYSMMFERLNEHIHDNNLVYVCLSKEMEQFVDGFYLVTLRKKDNCVDKTLFDKHQIPIRRDKNKVVGIVLFKQQTVAERRVCENNLGYITLAQFSDNPAPVNAQNQSTNNSKPKPIIKANVENNKRKEQFSESSEVKRLNTEKKSVRLDPRLNRPSKPIPVDLPPSALTSPLVSVNIPLSVESKSDESTVLLDDTVLKEDDFNVDCNQNYLPKFDEFLDLLVKSTHLSLEKRLEHARALSTSPYLNKLTNTEKQILLEKYGELPEFAEIIREIISPGLDHINAQS